VLLLAFDTATPAVTLAVHDGARVLAQRMAVGAGRHGELLAAAMADARAECRATQREVTAVAVGTGPGPYTGLRVGLVTARVLASALGVPLYGVCTLDVIAREAAAAAAGREFLVATDARRREVYWARYTPDGQRASGPAVDVPAALPAGFPVAGQGAELYPDLGKEPIPPTYPGAAQLAAIAAARIARGDPGDPAEPLYLRKPDARVPGAPKRVTP
jgi:tRNA threonylcarbamoyl adenosine modification protein YeaZ